MKHFMWKDCSFHILSVDSCYLQTDKSALERYQDKYQIPAPVIPYVLTILLFKSHFPPKIGHSDYQHHGEEKVIQRQALFHQTREEFCCINLVNTSNILKHATKYQ